MEEHIGRECKIHIKRNNADLFYTGFITKITDTHITFVDKYSKLFTYKILEVIQIQGLESIR